MYDLNSDWSDVANPNGPWALLQGSSALPHVANWTPLGASVAQPAWAPSNTPGNFLPAWFKATSSAFDWQVGDVVVHTTDPANGASEGVANVEFTAPTSGVAEISGLVWNARDQGRGQEWQLFVGGTLVDGGNLPGDGSISRADPATFDFTNVSLLAGETVDLAISNTSGVGDFVGNDLKISLADDDSLAETPTLTAPSFLTVTAGGSTPMGISVSPTNSDDTLSVTISGVPLFEINKGAKWRHGHQPVGPWRRKGGYTNLQNNGSHWAEH